MKLLIISSVRGDTRRYRTIHLWEQAKLLGLDVHLSHITNNGLSAQAEKPWDLVVMHRVPFNRYVERLYKKFRSKGALILFDVDDLIFEVSAFQYINSPDFSDPLRASLYKSTMQKIRRALEAADGAVASTDFLAQYIRAMGKPVWVHRNAFSLEMFKHAQAFSLKRRQPNQQVVIGYASGTPTHNRDFELVKPAIKEVLAMCPEAQLHIIGPLDIGDDWGRLTERVTRLSLVPWRELPGLLVQFDVNLAPLVADNPFSQSKSEIKYMEAAMVGVPTVASPTDAFQYAIRNEENGFLAATPDEWRETILKLVKDPDLRERIGDTAQKEVMDRYHPATRAFELQQMFEDILAKFDHPLFEKNTPANILERSMERLGQTSLSEPGMERDPSRIQEGLFVLRHGGSLITLIKMMLIFFRRFVSPVFPYSKIRH